MEKFGLNQLRKMYLEFFESKDHLALKSFSLVPHNDNSLLLINAGMAPLKPYFTGQETPPRKRVTTCQKCVRTGDIDNVGKTARHLTFFEMLGNFSFGDYFKEEAIEWSWEFLTKNIGMDPDRLYPSVFGEDDEAFSIWENKIGIPAEKITRFYRDPVTGESDNFWEHGAGPCGPCSEIYYDRGEKYGCGRPDCKVGCECDRYMEVWNNVFTQFESDGKGNYTELDQKNIDTGMGLERLAVVVQDVDSVFDVDTMKAIRDKICEMSQKTYKTDALDDVSIRLITDHIRSSTFMVSDGIMPSNEGRGYVLRRLIRRAARHGKMLGIEGEFLAKLSETVIAESKDGYPELEERHDFICKVLAEEEAKFDKTIDQGLMILSQMKEELAKSGSKTLSGEDAFKLYDTFGFPLDLTAEILEEDGIAIDEVGFEACMKKQRDQARAARKTTNYMGADASVFESLDTSIHSTFTGYEKITDEGKVIAIAKVSGSGENLKTELVDNVSEGDNATIITDITPFYATMGGQKGDIGVIKSGESSFEVDEAIKVVGDKIGHVGVISSGSISIGDKVMLSVDSSNRNRTCQNHSATHLLHKALREVLGSHVAQAGSYQDNERTRFDFSHFSAMTDEELSKVEDMVNAEIAAGLDVVTDVMSIDEAQKSGAMALFGEKYDQEVRVVSMGDFSKELCGGTHVSNTADIVAFKIVSESGIASGVRRIEALTGAGVIEYYKEKEALLDQAASIIKAAPNNIIDKLTKLVAENKELSKTVESLKAKAAKEAMSAGADDAVDIGGIKLIATSVSGVDMNGLRDLSDELKTKLGDGVVVIASENDGKVNLVVSATDAAIKAGAHAGNLIKEIAPLVGGGGGGRPNMAQAGGKNAAGIDDALAKAKEVLASQVG